MNDIRPGAPWTGDGYCVRCKDKREFSTIVSVVQMRLVAKGYCSFCGTKLNRPLGPWEPPAPETVDEFYRRAARAYLMDPVVHAKVKMARQVFHAKHLFADSREIEAAMDGAVIALAVTGDSLRPDPYGTVTLGPVVEDFRNFKPTHWEGPNGMHGKLTDPTVAYEKTIEAARTYDGCDDPRCSWCKNPSA